QRKFKTHSIIANLVSRIADPAAALVLAAFGNKNLSLPGIALSGEEDKIVDYFDLLLSQDTRTAHLASLSRTLGTLGGEMGDLGLLYSLGAGSLKAPVALGKLAVRIGSKIGAKSFYLGRTAVAVSHAVATSVLGVARENLKDLFNNVPRDPDMQKVLLGNAKWFGGYFLGDIAFNMLANVLFPMMKGIGRSFVQGKWGADKLFYKGLSRKEFLEVARDTFSGRAINPSFLKTMPAKTVDYLEAIRDSSATFYRVDKQNPEEIFKMIALSRNYVAKQDGTKWIMRQAQEELGKAKTLDTFDAARQWFEDQLAKGPKVKLTTEEGRLLGAFDTKSKIRRVLKGKLKEGAEEDIRVLTRLIAPTDKTFTTKRVHSFSRALVKTLGLKPGDIKVNTLKDALAVSYQGIEMARFPKKVLTAANEVAPIRQLVEKLQPLAKRKSPLFKTSLVTEYTEALKTQHLHTPAWVEKVATDPAGLKASLKALPAGKYELTMP
ncbi:hypothetical protein LCGC14_2522170, partial [marine sediment metagenome]